MTTMNDDAMRPGTQVSLRGLPGREDPTGPVTWHLGGIVVVGIAARPWWVGHNVQLISARGEVFGYVTAVSQDSVVLRTADAA